ncbi:MAG: hypothetical protein AAF251_00625 [Pseudomonadota bacterium]
MEFEHLGWVKRSLGQDLEAKFGPLKGVSMRQIQTFEAVHGLALCEAHKELLLWLGESTQDVLFPNSNMRFSLAEMPANFATLRVFQQRYPEEFGFVDIEICFAGYKNEAVFFYSTDGGEEQNPTIDHFTERLGWSHAGLFSDFIDDLLKQALQV